MRNERIVNQLRAFHYLSGVLKNQQNDPLCGKCLAFEKVSNTTMDNFLKCESDCRSKREYFSEELPDLFRRVYDQLAAIQHPDELIGQKKAGKCKLPEGVCFTMAAVSLYEKMGD
jgi:hypothetical protein